MAFYIKKKENIMAFETRQCYQFTVTLASFKSLISGSDVETYRGNHPGQKCPTLRPFPADIYL